MGRPSKHARLVERPPGTETVAELHARLGFPPTTIRAHFAPAIVGRWLPGLGARHPVLLFESREVNVLLRTPPARRAVAARPRKRRRPSARQAADYDLPDAWTTASELARKFDLPSSATVLRVIQRHNERAFPPLLARGVGDPRRDFTVEQQRRIVDGRQQWTFPAVPAWKALRAALQDRRRRRAT